MIVKQVDDAGFYGFKDMHNLVIHRSMKTLYLFGIWGLLFPFASLAQQQVKEKTNEIWSVKSLDETHCYQIVRELDILGEGWDTLQQVYFWKEACTLEPQYYIIYALESREILGYAETKVWNKKSAAEKKAFIAERRRDFEIPASHTIVTAQGRKDFYLFEETIPNIHKAIDIFIEEHTDPWYAQAILLIESPGAKIKTSYAGARGSFQLMPEVAREMGLKVTETQDERDNFKRSAQAAAKLIRTQCVPQVRAMLQKRGIAFHETDLWFRLLVMHTYHAGGGNVSAALSAINAKSGGQALIQRLWKTTAGGFGNESQNYSQIALAAVFQLMLLIEEQGDIICKVEERAW